MRKLQSVAADKVIFLSSLTDLPSEWDDKTITSQDWSFKRQFTSSVITYLMWGLMKILSNLLCI